MFDFLRISLGAVDERKHHLDHLPPSTQLSSWRRVRKWNLCVLSVLQHYPHFLVHQGHGLGGYRRGRSTYLQIDRKIRIPTVWWHDLTDAIFACFVRDGSYIFHRISKFGFGWAKSGCFAQLMRPIPYWQFSMCDIAFPLDGSEIQRSRSPSAVRKHWGCEIGHGTIHSTRRGGFRMIRRVRRWGSSRRGRSYHGRQGSQGWSRSGWRILVVMKIDSRLPRHEGRTEEGVEGC